MRRSTGALAVAGACGAMVALPSAASALTKTVYAGVPNSAKGAAVKVLGKPFLRKYSPELDAFLLSRATIHVGDTVSFVNTGFHTIDLPGPSGADLPFVTTGPQVQGVKDQAGKLFWFNGKVPSIGLNPALFAPIGSNTYDGSARVASGLPTGSGPPKPFNVTFTKAGTYKYFCDIHPGMVGTIVVKPAGQSIPSAAKDAAALKSQINADLKALKRASTPKLAKHQVSVGGSDGGGAELLAMIPSQLRVKSGTVVTFSVPKGSREAHTATFGPTGFLKTLGNAFLMQPGPTQEGAYPSSPTQPIPLAPKSHGNGFANTGLIDRDPGTKAIPVSGRIKFTKPGVYHFICLIHTNMRGTIIVTK